MTTEPHSDDSRQRERLPLVLELVVARRRTLLALLALLTLAFSAGISRLRVEIGLLDWLPRDSPNVAAFRALLDGLPGAVSQELLWLELDPEKAGRHGVESIADSGSLYAQEELVRFLRARVPGISGEFGVFPLVRAVSTLLPGGAVATGELPPSAGIVALARALLETTPAAGFVDALISEDRQGTILALALDAPALSPRARELGLRLHEALREYRESPDVELDLFRDEYLVPAGLSSGIALMDRMLLRDLVRLTPLAALLLVLVLRALLGSWGAIGRVLATLAVGAAWTLGILGWTGTPLNVVTVALIPLVLGCGIDYAILVSVEASDRRAAGLPPRAALASLARSSLRAIFVVTLTTVAGLLVLTLADSPGITELGLHAALGMAIMGFLSAAVLPAFLCESETRHPVASRLGALMERNARWIGGHRVLALGVWGCSALACLLFLRSPVTSLDLIEGNFPADSPVARSAREMRTRCGGAFPEIVVVRGDLGSPEALGLLGRLKRRVESSPLLGERFRVAGAPDLLLLARAGSLLGLGETRAAETREQVVEAVRDLHSSPAWAPLARLLIDPDCTIGTLLLLGGDAGTDEKSVEAVWSELDAIVREEAGGAGLPGLTASFVGYRTLSFLFVTHSRRWIRLAGAVSAAAVVLLTALFVRKSRAVLLVSLLVAGGSMLWVGLLRVAGIYLSVFLLFPLVFSICVGSDYGLHLLCSLRPQGRQLWSLTGRSIAIAALTDAGVFLIYSRMELVSVSSVMLAVVLAVLAAFLSAVVLVAAGAPRAPPS